MKTGNPGVLAGVVWLVAAVSLSGAGLVLERTIPLPGVAGRIDHFSSDSAGQRLFVAALGNNTVEVLDLKPGGSSRTFRGFAEPQGVLFLPESNQLCVANGGDGTLRILEGGTGATLRTLALGDDADNLRYDPVARLVYVGYGSGALGAVDPATGKVAADIPLGAHPEAFQLAQADSRIFVNLPGAHTVAVVDRRARKVVAEWSLGLAAGNFPMALDEAHHRLFVACRLPARLLVFDTGAGKEIARLDLHGDCDDLFYTAASNQLYASCGEGFIDVFAAPDSDQLQRIEAVKTVAGARTCLLAGDVLYLAVARRGRQSAEIRCYRLAP